MTIKSISTFVICALLATISLKTTAQDCTGKITNHKQFDIKTLESKWTTYTRNPGFKILLDDVKRQGFTRIENNERTAWGFDADFTIDPALSSPQDTEICAFDFYKKTSTGVQFCSMLWKKVGGTLYRAYIIFPEGEKDVAKAFEKSQEFFVDENNKIQKAKSFGRCWSRCLDKRFSSANCAGAMVVCGAAAGGLVLAGIGVTTPIALGAFAFCAGITCLFPLATCAAACA